ncbi:kinesin-like protein KIF19 [Pollicipes pollicipes]|uniref:kinesin-like protein KIF19 n=1 Tax=Pollicipes pollicipes TaxID=41117 RepID=UPI00188583DA|nr:kinesin-like protein KIF19 [Pollicipes pollicipes]
MGAQGRRDPAQPAADGSASSRLTVAVRVRPLAPNERARGRVADALDNKMITLQENDGDKKDVLRQKRRHEKQFVYDMAFGEHSTQKELYERTTRGLVDDVLQGFNATVFAYGPTGAGKTYTMVGTPEQPGIMVRALNDLFKAMEARREEIDFKMTLSYLEIYNENIRDLLKPSSHTLELREDAKKGTIDVAGLSEVTTLNTKEVMRLLTKGNKERTMESTAANKTSSRSHALLQVNVRQQSRVRDITETVKIGRLYMIDLAGSERAKRTKNQGKRLQEGAHINRSLLALGNCINALAVKGSKYVNYRDSKLTRLLKDALSGNCRTVMIAHISPAMAQRDETFNTLVYADRAKNITNKVKRNVLDVTHQVSQYQNIIADLKNEIGRLKNKITVQEEEPEPDPTSQPRSKEQEEELRLLRKQLVNLFREQMELRHQMIEIDNVLLWLAMEFEKQTALINEYEQERALQSKRTGRAGSDGAGEADSADGAWDDLRYIQEEEQRYQEMRKNAEIDMIDLRTKASKMEEALPEKTSTDEQKELLELLLKTHELEIENMEMRSNQLIKDHELRRRDLMILRYDRQRTLCDEIISRQRQLIEDMDAGRGSNNMQMPAELQDMYDLYTQEVHGANGQRNSRFLNELNEILRTPSMLSLRPGDVPPLHSSHQALDERGRLPPISGDKEEKLFQQLPRRNSLELEKRRRPESPLSLRSASGSVPSSASPLQLPPIQGSMAYSELSSGYDRREMKENLRGLQSVIGRRRRRGRHLSGSAEVLTSADGSSADSREGWLRRSSSYDDLGSLSDLGPRRSSSFRSRRRSQRLTYAIRGRDSIMESDDEYDDVRLPSLGTRPPGRRPSLHNGLATLPSIGDRRTARRSSVRPSSEGGASVISFSLMR